MLSKISLSLISQALLVVSGPLFETAAPLSFDQTQKPTKSYDWTAGYIGDFTLHSSCNATQKHELLRGLNDAVNLAKHAKEHILVHGSDSPIYQKYFGNVPTGAVLGWFEKIATANRKGAIFRCDDPDRNCRTQKNWAGHHRGKNASSETVICETSFHTRLPLEALCMRGFDIANGKINRYWGADLLHRLYHLDKFGEGAITHITHSYQTTLNLAASENYSQAATNTDSLLYFAMDSYAFDISNPGEGCTGIASKEIHEHAHSNPHKHAAAADKKPYCHTHPDGEVHCH
ncbi:pH-regulated antigen PRA1 [Golovinomyces cichoracearum]|uniref:pH-regulated antigen PRA1 n=1 Tax=Golovinomyces cichoracearum TaxID=62708 RepID=A0A420J5D8_9PEZI|nr:pH-regulated antigen PRA1 [Golovinomyces cichoracearum]